MKSLYIIIIIILFSCSDNNKIYNYDSSGILVSILYKTDNKKDKLENINNGKITSVVYFNKITEKVDSFIGYEFYHDIPYKMFKAVKEHGKNGIYKFEKRDSTNRIVGVGNAKLLNKGNKWELIEDGWFSQYYSGNLIREIDYKSFNDSLIINQFKEYKNNGEIIDSLSLFYTITPSLDTLEIKKGKTYTFDVKLHYVNKGTENNYSTTFVLSDNISSDFTNIKPEHFSEINENFYNVEEIDKNHWKFTLECVNSGSKKLRGFIYLFDQYNRRSKNSSKFEVSYISSYIYIDESFVVR